MINIKEQEKNENNLIKNKFMQQFEFKEPVLKRKRNEIEKQSKSNIEKKLNNDRINKEKENFHKSLNLCKDNLELEMMFEDPNDKKNKSKSNKLE